MDSTPSEEWDAFISHASEDKDFVRELVSVLDKFGVRLWYDEFKLKLGDSLVASINKGLAHSPFGVLVLSAAFLGKPWPEYERRGITSRDVAEGGILIPVWRGVTRAQVAELSPTLADRYAVDASSTSTLETALRLLSVMRPDRFESLSRRIAIDEMLSGGQTEVADATAFHEGPIRHEKLPADLLRRIRVIHQVFEEVYDIDWDGTVRNFKRDLRPDREVMIWENMAAVYLQLVRELTLDAPGRRELCRALLIASSGDHEALDQVDLAHVTTKEIWDAYSELNELIAADADYGFGPLGSG
jgi:TIR domain